jgi:16S rRNA (cytidine1402-2'-O)-methyltransferase
VQSGVLYLFPVPIADEPVNRSIPVFNTELISSLDLFFVEDAKTARRHLKSFGYTDLQKAEMHLLNEHTDARELPAMLEFVRKGRSAGLMSEAGCPGIADPGAAVVALAHNAGIKVVPLAGPSAVVLAVMASGFNGQNFAFTGYLPLEKADRVKRIRELEQLAQRHRQAQFFIETPYRNLQLFELLTGTLNPHTLLFVGRSILSSHELLLSRSAGEWRKLPAPELHKEPAVFGIFTNA